LTASINTVLSIFPLILFKEKPPTPPSFTASLEKEPLMMGLKHLVKNKNYILILVFFTFVLGTFLTQGPIDSFIY
jgi:FLVCR family feline leukemia virus subgroup C receptor-related protein